MRGKNTPVRGTYLGARLTWSCFLFGFFFLVPGLSRLKNDSEGHDLQ